MKCVRTIVSKIDSGGMDATLPKLHGGHAEALTSSYLASRGLDVKPKTGGEGETGACGGSC